MDNARSGSSWLSSSLSPWSWTSAEASDEQTRGGEDFQDLEALQFIRVMDEHCKVNGKRLVVVTGRRLMLYPGLDLERLSRYVLHKLHAVSGIGEAFVVVYVHTEVSYMENCPGVYWLRSLFYRIPSQIMQQMDQLYVLHCNWSLWLSLSYWCPRDLWGKLQYLSRIEFLEDILQGELDLPEFVLEHDKLLEEQPLADYGILTSKDYMRNVIGEAPAGVHPTY